jgi:hypothetical protein
LFNYFRKYNLICYNKNDNRIHGCVYMIYPALENKLKTLPQVAIDEVQLI